MPVKMKDGLSAPGPDVHDHAVILEPGESRCLGDELEHLGRFVVRKRADLTERVDVTHRKNQQVDRSLRSDVSDRDEAPGSVDVRALGDESAEEAIGV
jgi:hypothetical protein